MMRFYTPEEFESQMIFVMHTEGVDRLEAFRIVCERERRDAEEYERWLDLQVTERECYNEFG